MRYINLRFTYLFTLQHSSGYWSTAPHAVSIPNEGTLLLCISVYAVTVDVLTHAVDLHKTASRCETEVSDSSPTVKGDAIQLRP